MHPQTAAIVALARFVVATSGGTSSFSAALVRPRARRWLLFDSCAAPLGTGGCSAPPTVAPQAIGLHRVLVELCEGLPCLALVTALFVRRRRRELRRLGPD
jgi:hypothetical protein